MAINGRKTTITKNETNYRTFFEFASDGIFIADNDGNYTDVNEIGLKMLGYTRKELLQLNLKDLIPKEKLEIGIKRFSEIRNGKIVSGEQHLICKDGTLLPVEISASVLPNGSLIGMVRDITGRKRSEAEIERLNRVYEVISQINQMVVRTNKSEILFSEACRIAIDYGKFRMAWMGLIEEKKNTVKPIVWSGVEDGYLREVKIIPAFNVAEGSGPTGTAIREGKYIISNDIANDLFMLPFRDEALKRGYHSSISLPIIIQGKTIGAFNIYASESHFFNEKEIQSLLEVTNNIAFALEKIEDENYHKQAELKKDYFLNFNKRLIENSPIGILMYNVSSGQCVLANESVGKTIGATTEKLLAQNFWKIPSWKDSGLLKSAELAIETVESQRFTAHFTTTFGKNVWLDCRMVSMFVEGEKHLLLMITDITERKHADGALKESEEKFRTIFDNASDGILLADAETKKFVMGNKMICTMLGYNNNEIINLSVADIHPKEDLPAVIEAFEKQIKKEIQIAENL